MRARARVRLAGAALPACCAAAAAGERPVAVCAAASLAEAPSELGAAYEVGGGGPVRFSFAASSQLARQIEAGAACRATAWCGWRRRTAT